MTLTWSVLIFFSDLNLEVVRITRDFYQPFSGNMDFMPCKPSSGLIFCIWSLVLITSISSLLVYMFATKKVDFQHKKYHDPCFGHFHFCSFKKMLQENNLYGELNSKDFYDLSALQIFPTKFFVNRSPKPRSERIAGMRILTKFTNQEHKNKWLFKNLQEHPNISGKNRTLICSYRALDDFAYHFKILGIKKADTSNIMISVYEKRKANHIDALKPILGLGLLPNIFGNVSTPITTSACETLSSNGGKYYIECPILESDFTIEIRATYIPPSFYRIGCGYDENYLLKTYSSAELKTLGLYLPKPFSQSTKMPRCSSAAAPKKPGFWIKLNGIWHWSTKQCYQSFRFDEPTRQCLKTKNILLLGDSHMRERTHAMTASKLWNATFMFSSVSAELAERLDKCTRDTIPDVIVLGSGSWSLVNQDISTYLSDMKKVFQLIKSLKAKAPLLHFIWIDILPYNHNHIKWMHNLIIVAMNDWVNHFMTQLGVDIIPAFDIAFPMSSQTRDFAHYFNDIEKDVIIHKERASVGGVIASILINHICPV